MTFFTRKCGSHLFCSVILIQDKGIEHSEFVMLVRLESLLAKVEFLLLIWLYWIRWSADEATARTIKTLSNSLAFRSDCDGLSLSIQNARITNHSREKCSKICFGSITTLKCFSFLIFMDQFFISSCVYLILFLSVCASFPTNARCTSSVWMHMNTTEIFYLRTHDRALSWLRLFFLFCIQSVEGTHKKQQTCISQCSFCRSLKFWLDFFALNQRLHKAVWLRSFCSNSDALYAYRIDALFVNIQARAAYVHSVMCIHFCIVSKSH